MNRLVIFGIGEMAQLAHFYFSADSQYDVVAFTVDSAFLVEKIFCGIPVVPFEDLTSLFPPGDNDLFIAMGYSKLNAARQEKYEVAKSMGYKLATYISSHATVLNKGDIGDNCFILEDNTIQPFVKIGNNVILWSGNHIGHHTTIGDHTFITSHVVVSGGVEIGKQCFIGVNATIRDHIKIGDRCLLGAGTILMKNAEMDGLYIPNQTERLSASSGKIKNI